MEIVSQENHDQYRADLGQRLLTAVTRAKSKGDVAQSAGVSTEQLNKWIRGEVKVPAEALRAIAAYTDVGFGWLVTGDGDMLADQTGVRLRRMVERMSDHADRAGFGSDQMSNHMVPLPLYEDVHASAGAGLSPPSNPATEAMVAFDHRFLKEKGAIPERCAVITARGDSMSPTIPDGSLLVVDHSQTQISNGCIMVINLGDDLLVKRVRRRLDGLIDLVSDNQAYPPETIGTNMLHQLRVVGRVVYFCRTP